MINYPLDCLRTHAEFTEPDAKGNVIIHLGTTCSKCNYLPTCHRLANAIEDIESKRRALKEVLA
jgi:hypothetical protein